MLFRDSLDRRRGEEEGVACQAMQPTPEGIRRLFPGGGRSGAGRCQSPDPGPGQGPPLFLNGRLMPESGNSGTPPCGTELRGARG